MGGGGAGFSPTDPNDIFASLFGGMGGGMGGGMPGMGSRGSSSRRPGSRPGSMPNGFGFGGGGGMDIDSDDDMGIPGGFGGGRPKAQRTSTQPDEPASVAEKALPCTLEELFKGATKKMKINRKLLSGDSESKVLEVKVNKGESLHLAFSAQMVSRLTPHVSQAGKLAQRSDTRKQATRKSKAARRRSKRLLSSSKRSPTTASSEKATTSSTPSKCLLQKLSPDHHPMRL